MNQEANRMECTILWERLPLNPPEHEAKLLITFKGNNTNQKDTHP